MQPVMIRVAGAEKLVSPKAQSPIWLRTRVSRAGSLLKATTYMVVNGNPIVMRNEVDLAPIVRALASRAKRKAQVSGDVVVGLSFFKKIGRGIKKVANKIGKSKLIRGVMKGVHKVAKGIAKVGKAIIKSPITAGIVAAVSVIYPPVGIAAAGVLAAANAGLAAAEGIKKVAKGVKKVVQTITKGKKLAAAVKKIGPARAKAVIAKSPKVKAAIAKTVKASKTMKKLNEPKNKAAILRLKANADKAKQAFKDIAVNARYAKDPTVRDHALKVARVVKIAAVARAKARGVAEKNSGGVPGLFVDSRGKIHKGTYQRVLKRIPTSRDGFVYQGTGDIERGAFVVAPSDREAASSSVRKADAQRAAKAYGKNKAAAKRGTRADVIKANAAMKKAKASNMTAAQKADLAKALKNKVKAKAKVRGKAVLASKREALKKIQAVKKPAASKKAAVAKIKQLSGADKAKAVLAMKKAKASGMSAPNQKKLAAQLVAKMKANQKARVSGLSDVIGCDCPSVGYDCIRL